MDTRVEGTASGDTELIDTGLVDTGVVDTGLSVGQGGAQTTDPASNRHKI